MGSEILNKIGINVKNVDNISKFFSLLCIINDEHLDNKIKILKFHKIPLVSLNQIKVLALSSQELERRITVSKSNNFFVEVINSPLTLLKSNRFTFRSKHENFLIEIEKTDEQIVLPKEHVTKVDNIINLTGVSQKSDFDKILDEAFNEKIDKEDDFEEVLVKSEEVVTPSLSEEEYDRYENLSIKARDIEKITNINLVDNRIDVDINIVVLVINEFLTDEEILFKAINYNNKFVGENLRDINNAIYAVSAFRKGKVIS